MFGTDSRLVFGLVVFLLRPISAARYVYDFESLDIFHSIELLGCQYDDARSNQSKRKLLRNSQP